jgi:phosphatidylglycerol:prolipoprotein diacylglycerol transferase
MISPQSPFALSVFGYSIRYYSVFMVIAMLLGCLATYFIAKKYYKEIDPEILFDLFPVLLVSGVLGARFYYVLLNLKYFSHHLNEVLAVQNGGISIHGAILGGLLGGIIFCKIKKLPILPLADVVSYGLILGQAIGRWGNFFNSEAFGTPCTCPWKLYVAREFRPIQYINYEYFHPTFLYEFIWNLIVFAFLFFVVRKIAKNKEGIVFFAYIGLYSLGRFFIEMIRTDSVLNIGTIPVAQIASTLGILVSLAGIFILNKNVGKKLKEEQ